MSMAQNPNEFSGLQNLHSWYYNSFLDNLISPMSAGWLIQLKFCILRSTRYPSLLGKQK